MSLTDGLEAYLAIISTVEYLWGRLDISVKSEEKQRKRLRKKEPNFEELTKGEGR